MIIIYVRDTLIVYLIFAKIYQR